jgi:hypothetical protein
MEIPIELVAIIGIILGLVGRTILPYFKKLGDNPGMAFEVRYIITAFSSAVFTAILVYPMFTIPEGSMFAVFMSAAIFSWGVNDIVNKMVK